MQTGVMKSDTRSRNVHSLEILWREDCLLTNYTHTHICTRTLSYIQYKKRHRYRVMCTDTQTQRHRNTLKHIQESAFCPKAHIHPFIHKYLLGNLLCSRDDAGLQGYSGEQGRGSSPKWAHSLLCAETYTEARSKKLLRRWTRDSRPRWTHMYSEVFERRWGVRLFVTVSLPWSPQFLSPEDDEWMSSRRNT